MRDKRQRQRQQNTKTTTNHRRKWQTHTYPSMAALYSFSSTNKNRKISFRMGRVRSEWESSFIIIISGGLGFGLGWIHTHTKQRAKGAIQHGCETSSDSIFHPIRMIHIAIHFDWVPKTIRSCVFSCLDPSVMCASSCRVESLCRMFYRFICSLSLSVVSVVSFPMLSAYWFGYEQWLIATNENTLLTVVALNTGTSNCVVVDDRFVNKRRMNECIDERCVSVSTQTHTTKNCFFFSSVVFWTN